MLPILGTLSIGRVRGILHHGWNQMFNPMAFVPKVGSVEIVEVRPKSITLMSGQPLEISLSVRDPQNRQPNAVLLFDNEKVNRAEVAPAGSGDDSLLHYSYRLEHVEDSMKFRVEVGGSESPWYSVNVVKQVKLEQLSLAIDAPPYTNTGRAEFHLKADEIEKTPISAAEGSKIEIAGQFDVPTSGALIAGGGWDACGDGGARWGTSIQRELSADAGLGREHQPDGERADYLDAAQPAAFCAVHQGWVPSIEMKWPTSDMNVGLDQEIKVRAILKDDHGLSAVRVLMGTGGRISRWG